MLTPLYDHDAAARSQSMAGRRATRVLPDEGMKLLDRFPDHVRDVMLRLRDRILRVAPRASEVVADVGYTVALRYGPDDKMKNSFVYITGFSKHANLGFLGGASLDDPEGVLEGTGAAMRHVKFASASEIAEAGWLDGYLEAAIAQVGFKPSLGDAQTDVRARSGKRR
jgi:hypothetical protein